MSDENSREIEAALHEDDKPEPLDSLSPEQRRIIEEEAMAEEEFIADQEDSVNPLLFKKEEKKVDAQAGDGLSDAFGSGELMNDESTKLISNEEELRKENVNDDNLNNTPPADGALPVDGQDLDTGINASMGAASAVDLGAESLAPATAASGTSAAAAAPNPIAVNYGVDTGQDLSDADTTLPVDVDAASEIEAGSVLPVDDADAATFGGPASSTAIENPFLTNDTNDSTAVGSVSSGADATPAFAAETEPAVATPEGESPSTVDAGAATVAGAASLANEIANEATPVTDVTAATEATTSVATDATQAAESVDVATTDAALAAPTASESAEPAPTPAETKETAPASEPKKEEAPAPVESASESAAATPTPIPAGMPTTSDPTPASTNANNTPAKAEKPKKKKGGIVALIIILLVLICGGVGAFIFYTMHEDPKKQVSDAIGNMLDAPVLGMVSKAATIAAGNSPSINIDFKTSYLDNNNVTISTKLAFKSSDESSIYFRAAGLRTKAMNDAITKLMEEEFGGGVTDCVDVPTSYLDDEASGMTDCLTEEGTTGDDLVSTYIEKYDDIVKPIDEKWIKISADGLGDEYGKTIKCFIKTAKEMVGPSYRKQLAEFYKDNSFISLDESAPVENRDGVNYYVVHIDENIAKKFGDKVKETAAVKSLPECIYGEGYLDSSDSGDAFGVDSSSEVSDVDKNLDIKLGITPWSHELKAVEIVAYEDKSYEDSENVTMNVSFDFVSDSDLDSAIDIGDAMAGFAKTYKEYVSDSALGELEEVCSDPEYAAMYEGEDAMFKSVDECVEYFEELYGDIEDDGEDGYDFDKLFSSKTGFEYSNDTFNIEKFSLVDES